MVVRALAQPVESGGPDVRAVAAWAPSSSSTRPVGSVQGR
jgi:hypothetical protein